MLFPAVLMLVINFPNLNVFRLIWRTFYVPIDARPSKTGLTMRLQKHQLNDGSLA